MSTSAPIPLIQNGLVFCYDTSNVKSYRGQPTTNVAVNPLDLYAWTNSANAATLSRDTTTSLSPVGGIPLKMVPSGNDPYTNTYNSSTWNLGTASNGQTWTASVWVKANRNIASTGELFLFEAPTSGAYTNFGAVSVTFTTDWQRVSTTRTNNQASTVAVQARLDGPNSYTAGDIIWWDGLQVEQKSYTTQFVNGTRSNTDGLLDLTRNNTINLANAGFNTSADITLNGTSNYIQVPDAALIRPSSGYITVIVWFKSTSTGTENDNIVYNKENEYEMAAGGGWITHAFRPDWNWRRIAAYNLNQWYCVAITYDQVNQKAYVNGTLQYQSAVTGAIGASYTNDLGIGARNLPGSAFSYFAGQVPILYIYNRALNASEVLQVYNSTKSRFGL